MRTPLLPIALVAAAALAAGIWVVINSGSGQGERTGDFSGERCLKHVAVQVGFGPRVPGGEEIGQARKYMESHLSSLGWRVKRQVFTDATPRGRIEFVNLRARFAPEGEAEPDWNSAAGLLLLCSHYDTKFFDRVEFLGANDGASSTAVLLELAEVLQSAPVLASGLELVFFDGEEAVVDFTAVDGLYGSRHYAKQWRSAPPGQRPTAAFVLDLVGDASLRIDPPSDSPRPLLMELYKAAEEIGERRRFGIYESPITDDHLPLNAAGIPALDVIDSDYLRRGRWHTPGDNLDSISADSLQLIGETMLQLLRNRSAAN